MLNSLVKLVFLRKVSKWVKKLNYGTIVKLSTNFKINLAYDTRTQYIELFYLKKIYKCFEKLTILFWFFD